eukprot:RCo045559
MWRLGTALRVAASRCRTTRRDVPWGVLGVGHRVYSTAPPDSVLGACVAPGAEFPSATARSLWQWYAAEGKSKGKAAVPSALATLSSTLTPASAEVPKKVQEMLPAVKELGSEQAVAVRQGLRSTAERWFEQVLALPGGLNFLLDLRD